jgi:hypothetical protein
MQQSRSQDGGTTGGRFFPLAPDFRNDVDVSRGMRVRARGLTFTETLGWSIQDGLRHDEK